MARETVSEAVTHRFAGITQLSDAQLLLSRNRAFRAEMGLSSSQLECLLATNGGLASECNWPVAGLFESTV